MAGTTTNTIATSPAPTVRKSHAVRREEIARAALKLAGERGVAKVSTQAIADHLNVSQATIFRHFKTRDDVFLEAIALIKRDVMQVLSPIFDDKATPGAKRLQRLIHAHLGFVQDRHGIPALLFSDSLHQDAPILKAEVRQLMKVYAGRVAGLVMDGKADGSLSPDADPALLGQTLVTMVQGVVLRWSLFDKSFDLQSQADVVWTLFRPALANTPLKDNK